MRPPKRTKADHSQAPASTSTVMTATVTHPGSHSSVGRNSAASTTAVMIRLRSATEITVRSSLDRAVLRGRLPETALAPGKEGVRLLQIAHCEVRPQLRAEVQLGVGQIPQQEVTEPLLGAGADQQVGLRQPRERQCRTEARLADVLRPQGAARALARQLLCRLHDIPAPAIAHGHLQPQAGIGGGALLGGGNAGLQAHREALALADETHAHPTAVELAHLAVDRLDEQGHQTQDLLGRAAPVLARKREQRERLDAALRTFLDAHAHRGEPRLVSGGAGESTRRRPAAIAVHDDGDVARQDLRLRHHTCMTSFSLAASSESISATCLSVSFCTSCSARRSSSCETCFSLSWCLMSFMTSRRTLRTATRAFSASWRSTLVISRRRSSVSGGIGMRTTVPAVCGVRPRSDLKMAFSIACTTLFSQGEMTSVRPSSTAMLATCCSGTSEP